MNTLLVLTALFTIVISSPVAVDSDNIDVAIDSVQTVVAESILDLVDVSTIIFWFFSIENPENGVPVNQDSLSALNGTSFNNTKDNIFIVHGWHNTNTSEFITTVKQAVLANLDVNLFVVDWSEIAAQNYLSARSAVVEVGKYIAEFIESLVPAFDLLLDRTTVIGHSLGAHVSGNAGGILNGNIEVIVGLDPALPLFLTTGKDGRLDASDAQFVQVIHTNGGLKGFVAPLGDSDYYVNGGSIQPGCGFDIDGSCSHGRAYEYYAESLSTDQFIAVACGDLLEVSTGLCNSTDTSVMGTYSIDKVASGLYYLTTNSESPYAQGLSNS